MDLPKKIKGLIAGRGYGDYAGEANVDPEMQATMKRIQNQVKLVQETESELQSGYWCLRGIAAKGSPVDSK